MKEELRVLILEDVATDAELVEHELRREGFRLTARRVETEEKFIAALESARPDLVLADYSLPRFDGAAALAIVQRRCPEVPFVFVSGAIGEDLAIESLKKGATDYVLKDRLSRLGSAVRRALEEAESRAARIAAEEALRSSEKRNRVLLEINNAIIANLDRNALLAAIAQSLDGVIPYDRCSLTLLDADRETLRVCGLAGSAADTPFPMGTEFALEDSNLKQLFDSGQPLVRHDLNEEIAIAEEHRLLEAGFHSYVCVPLFDKGSVTGSLNIGNRNRNCYSAANIDLLVEVGHQVALAVGNMLAYEEVARLKAQLEQENIYLQEEIKTSHNFGEIIGESRGMKKVFRDVETVAPTEANVLLTGETGTGKELIARAVHDLSRRKGKPLVKVNCAALPSGLVESELFGHEKGSFTGALARKIGRFELADRGTLFLDEIGDLPLDLQAKLLRVLQEGEFERVGGTKTFTVDVRLIAATNRDLKQEVEDERFRADLYYRLNVFPIKLPPLRDREGDVPLLARYFARKYSRKLGRDVQSIPKKVMNALARYPWAGNVRELENVIERGIILSAGDELVLGDWLPKPSEAPAPSRIPTLDELQRKHILEVLDLVGWKVSGAQGAAEILGLKPTTLDARMKRLGIRRPRP